MADDQTTAAQEWATAIRRGAAAGRANQIVLGINQATADCRANRGDVMVACASILGQSIVAAGPEAATEIRAGIMALIDGFATQLAVEGEA